MADDAQDQLVCVRSATIEDEGAVHASVSTDDEADPHVQIVVLNLQHRVGRKQRLRWANVSTSGHRQGLGNRRKLRDVDGHAVQALFPLSQ